MITDRAKEIRTALKAAGWTSRDVSVTRKRCTYSYTIRVEIKNAALPLALVESIARKHENVRRCEVTGEILAGGNTYLDVEYADSALAPFTSEILSLLPGDGGVCDVAGWRVLVTGTGWDTQYTARRAGSRDIVSHTAGVFARRIAIENLRREHLPSFRVTAECVEVSP